MTEEFSIERRDIGLVRACLGPSFATGTHVIFFRRVFPVPSGTDYKWVGIKVVGDQEMRRRIKTTEMLVKDLTEHIGQADSYHIYDSYEAAKAAHPDFFF